MSKTGYADAPTDASSHKYPGIFLVALFLHEPLQDPVVLRCVCKDTESMDPTRDPLGREWKNEGIFRYVARLLTEIILYLVLLVLLSSL